MTFSTCPACGAKTPDLQTHLAMKRDRDHTNARLSNDVGDLSDVQPQRKKRWSARRSSLTRKHGARRP